jgi:hypothetical protein
MLTLKLGVSSRPPCRFFKLEERKDQLSRPCRCLAEYIGKCKVFFMAEQFE